MPNLSMPSSKIPVMTDAVDADDLATPELSDVHDRAIGEILRRGRGLTDEQIAKILRQQRSSGTRFGDAAVQLGYLTREDVLWALSQQYHYHYTPNATDKVQRELVMARSPFSDEVEIFRDLRSQLMMTVLAPDPQRRALAITSADVADGKTFIAANLAVAFSQLPGTRTLVIDADMRTPRLHTVFGLDNDIGLSSILAGRSKPNLIRPVAELPNLYLMPVGAVPPNPTELLQTPTFAILVRELLNKFDYVIVDTPAASHGSDARVIAARCGAALLVGRKNRTRSARLAKLTQQLTKGTARLAGVVMNDY